MPQSGTLFDNVCSGAQKEAVPQQERRKMEKMNRENIILICILSPLLILTLALGAFLFHTKEGYCSSQAEVEEVNPSPPTASLQKEDNPSPSPSIGDIVKIFTHFRSSLSWQEKKKAAATLLEASRHTGLDPCLILAIIQVESNFFHRARSSVGAMGLMQIRPFVGKALARDLGLRWWGNEILYDPSKNIRMGVYFFHKLYQRFGDIDTALTAYNYGPTYVKKVLRKGKRLPKNYSQKVRNAYRSQLRNMSTILNS